MLLRGLINDRKAVYQPHKKGCNITKGSLMGDSTPHHQYIQKRTNTFLIDL